MSNKNFFLGIVFINGKLIRVRFQGKNCCQAGLTAIISAIKEAKQ